ncbi:MAG: substrate-binding domain-containing protein [Gammaproteobacteria bacterium]|nr:substrate-binding domain-containing protein [Gammaproteobacteria bacterium]
MIRGGTFVTLLLILATALAACSGGADQTSNEPEVKEIILATTTSTRDSGLLDVLVPDFEAQTGYVLKTVAVGTGNALKMGEQGDADVLLVHAPSAEKEFMDGGFGSERFLVMHNDFVIVGPPDDPAGIKGTVSAAETLAQIASTQAVFTSRGDDSGTHKVELSLWKDARVAPEGEWYLESGQGMGATLRIASEKGTYTLTDRATYLFNSDTLDLDILAEGDPILLNVYHVMIVNSEKGDHVNNEGGRAFADYLISPEVQALIAEYGVEEFGQPLFFPDADKTDADLGLE